MSADTQMQGGGFMGRSWGVLDFAVVTLCTSLQVLCLKRAHVCCRPRPCLWWEPAGARQRSPQARLTLDVRTGVAGLVGAIILGPRKSFKQGETPAHNVLLTFMGASLLWVGWFGFNAGSALAANGSAAMAMLVTHIAAATAGLSWMLT